MIIEKVYAVRIVLFMALPIYLVDMLQLVSNPNSVFYSITPL